MWDGVPPTAVGPATQRIAAVDHGSDGDADGYCDVCFPDTCGCSGGGPDGVQSTGGVLLVVGAHEGGGDEPELDDEFGTPEELDDLPIEPVGPAGPAGGAPPWAVRG